MSNPRYAAWIAFGTATVVTALPSARTTARTPLLEIRVPSHCFIQAVEAAFDTIAGGATTATLTIWRDSVGDNPFAPSGPAGATQTITTGTTTATDGGVVWILDRDHHPNADSPAAVTDELLPENQSTRLFVGIALNAGTAQVTRLTITWRA